MINNLYGRSNRRLFGLVLFLVCAASAGFGQTNPSKPEFVGSTSLSGQVGEPLRFQILVGGKGRSWVGSDDFTSAAISKTWKILTRSNGGLTNAKGQLDLFAASSASASNPAAGSLQWISGLPANQSWLAYLQVVVSNDLPVSASRYASAGLGLLQLQSSNRALILTNSSSAYLSRKGSVTNQAESVFILNNLPFVGSFSSNTAGLYTRQAGPVSRPTPQAGLVFSNLGSTGTLAYRSSVNSSALTNPNGVAPGVPGTATAVASPSVVLPSGTNWTVTVRAHYEATTFTSAVSYVGPAIVKNLGTLTPMAMFTNRVVLGLLNNADGLSVCTEAFAKGTNVLSSPDLYSLSENSVDLRFSFDAATARLTGAFDHPVFGWIDTDVFDLNNAASTLGRAWGFVPGKDNFRLLLAADTSANGGNGNGSAFKMYFTDLAVTTEPADSSLPKDGGAIWIGLRYDAGTSNLVHQFSPEDGEYGEMTNVAATSLQLANWSTNTRVAPMHLQIGAEAGQTNLPAGAVALRTFAVIPAPGDMHYDSPNLPPGLSLDSDYGVISGAPTDPGTTNFSVVASNPFGGLTTTQVFRLSVRPLAPELLVTTNGFLRFDATNNNALIVTATNSPLFGTSPLAFSASGLPSGVVLKLTTGGTQAVFGGVPRSRVGTNNTVIFTASNSLVGAVTITSVVTVEPGTPALTLVQNAPFPRYTAAGVSTSSPFWTLSNSAAGQNPNDFTNRFSVVSGFPTDALTLNTSNGRILARTSQITTAGIFSNAVFAISNRGGVATFTSTLTILPSAPTLVLASSPSFPSNGIALGATNTNFFQFNIDTNATGYSADFANTFAMQNGPSNLAINPSNGMVSGINLQAGRFTLQVTLRNLGGFSVTNVTLTSLPAAPAFAVTSHRVQFGVPSTNALVFRLTNTANLAIGSFPVTWTASNLPAEFAEAVVGTNFVISSADPVSIGTNSGITVVASNIGGVTVTSGLTLTVLPATPALRIQSNNLPFQVDKDAGDGIVISVTNTAGQNTNLYPVTFSASNLPAGWSLTANPTNRLMATIGNANPTSAVNLSNLVIGVANEGGTYTTTLSLRVLPPQPVFSITTNREMQFGTNSTNAVTFRVLAAGQNTNLYPVSLFASNLPAGVSLSTNATNRLIGVIGSTNPSQAGVFTNVILGASNVGGTSTVQMTLRVLPALPRITVATNRIQFGSNSPNALVLTATNVGQDLTNFPLSFSLTNAPGGLVLTNTNGFTATAGSTNPGIAINRTSFTVVVTNIAGAVTSTVSDFVILPALPELLVETNGDFQYGQEAASNAVTVAVDNPEGQNTNSGQFPVTFSTENLPAGITARVDTSNRLVYNFAGNPRLAGIFTNVKVRAGNQAGTNSNALTLTLLPARPELVTETSTNLLKVFVPNSKVIAFKIFNTEGQNFEDFPISYSVSNLPAGLALSNNSGSPTYTLTITGTPTLAGTFSNLFVTATNAGGSTNHPFSLVIQQATPSITWANPAAITYGTALSTNQLNATSSVAGTFTYNPTNGAILNAGTKTLTAVFTADDTTNYVSPVTNTVTLVVGKATPSITWTNPAAITYGTALSTSQLNAASSVAGTFTYNPTNGAIVNAGTNNILEAVFTADDTTNYVSPLTNTVTLVVNKASSTILFAALPTNKVYGEDPPFGLSASASSGLTVEFESLNTNVATLSGTNLTMQSAGTAPIVASQAGDSNYVAAASVTNPITILPGKPELDGLSFLTLTNLSTSAYFRYQVSARGAGQFWAGRSDFTNALTISWNTNGSSNAGASFSTNSGALRYVWNTTNSNSAYVTWKKALPLDSDWQVSVKVNFANDTNVTDLSGLNFEDADQHVENGLFAFKDSAASLDDYSLAFFRGTSNQPSGYVNGSGATNGTEGFGAVATNAAGGLAYLGLAFSASNHQLISLGNPNVTNSAWVNLFTNHVSPWTNAAYTNSLVLRLRGASYAPTNANYSAEFSDFVIVPLGNLSYSATNLPDGLVLDPATGLISGQPTASGTNTAEVVISNVYGTVTNTIEFQVP